MAGLPKKYAKMGFSKGWRLYKASKRKVKKIKKKVVKIARRKRYFKKKGRSRNKGLTTSNIVKVLVGAAGAVLYETFVSPMIPLDPQTKNIVELGLGLFLAGSSKMPMMVRATGAALATINAYSLLMPLISGMAGSSSGVANDGW